MCTERLTSESQLYELLVRTTGATRNGYELQTDEEMAPTTFDTNDTYAQSFVFLGDKCLKGTDYIIPVDRATFVTKYNGIYVSPEDQGFAVNVPVKGTRHERKNLEWHKQPKRLRYYSVDEIKGIDVDVPNLALIAAARAIFQVANGINTEGHKERVQTMFQNSGINKKLSSIVREEADLIWKIIHEAEPQLESLDTRMEQLYSEDSQGNKEKIEELATSFWALRDHTLEKLGLTERFKATLSRMDQ